MTNPAPDQACRRRSKETLLDSAAGRLSAAIGAAAVIMLFNGMVADHIWWWVLAAPPAAAAMAAATWAYLRCQPQDSRMVTMLYAIALMAPIALSVIIYAGVLLGNRTMTEALGIAAMPAAVLDLTAASLYTVFLLLGTAISMGDPQRNAVPG